MIVSQHKELLELLGKLSREDKLDWRPALIPDSFQVSFKDKGVVVRLADSVRHPPSAVVLIQLLNAEGEVADSFDDEELDNALGMRGIYYEEMKTLYDMARRRALGADKVIQDLLREMKSLDDGIPF